MNEHYFVKDTLDSLKKRLDNNESLLIQQDKGYVFNAKFSFNTPATQENIEEFCNQTGWTLPNDYQIFLKDNNGAKLFCDPFGSCVHLYSLEECIQNHLSYMEKEFIPIGYYLESYLFIDSNRVKNNREDYLLWFESGGKNYRELSINFATWLDRLVMAQGAVFWDWPIYRS